jgi:hypothetical protein
MITNAVKDNTIIIVYSNDYNKKVNKFIADNNFLLITNDFNENYKM